MRVVVAGGRDFNCPRTLDKWLKRIYRKHKDLEVVSGTARGADKLGEEWAKANNVPIKRFPADWEKYGKRAGMFRNWQMANYADAVIVFWDGKSRGTEGMIKIAKILQLPVKVVKYVNF